MTDRPTFIERAFDLAKSGRMGSVSDIRTTMRTEGYHDEGQLFGKSLKDQLAKLLAEAKQKRQ